MKIALTSKYRSCVFASTIGSIIALTASVAHAQFYVRGEFNNWDTSFLMAEEGDGLYTYHATGLTPGATYLFKIATDDWSTDWPGSDARVMAAANGEITFRAFDNQSWIDGWQPDGVRRVGYSDSGLHGWALAGDMNGWDPDITWHLTDMGNGLYEGAFFLAAGDYDYKFRKDDDWEISIGGDFGNSAGNIFLNVTEADTYIFQLDLWNGRHSVSVIPEPGTYAVIFGALALFGAFVYRRRVKAKP